MVDLCEYNPRLKVASYGGQVAGDCPNEAVICVGKNPSWHLCESCAALPRFKRFRRNRTSLRPASPQGENA